MADREGSERVPVRRAAITIFTGEYTSNLRVGQPSAGGRQLQNIVPQVIVCRAD